MTAEAAHSDVRAVDGVHCQIVDAAFVRIEIA